MRYILIFVLNAADYFLTVHLTSLYGIECEVNPLMRLALELDGAFECIKLLMFHALLFCMWESRKDEAALVILGMFIVVVLINATQAFYLCSI